jgi:Family of unknown function (DUF6338)
MADLIDPSNFDFFARYILAGLIIISIRARFIVGERPRLPDMLVEAVILSLLNQLIFLGITFILNRFIVFGWWVSLDSRAPFFVEVALFPTVLGSVFGWNLARGWNDALLRRLSMPTQNPVRRAYDHAFAHDRRDKFLILTYADGTIIYGFFGENSLAASDGNRSDIYFERIYDVGQDGQWSEKSPPRGALLSLEGMRSIEFLEPERADDVER